MYDSMGSLYLTLAILKYADWTLYITHNSLKTGRQQF